MPSTTYHLEHAIVTIHVRGEWGAESFVGEQETPLYRDFCEAVQRVTTADGQAERREDSTNTTEAPRS
ncbi:hypothetical protein [Ferroacidibacillus organovorans]|uniref:Uncharacterized protein n=1 Tax=Ferroacidibacillus organovorans TaxID=1765683 RepID=A0A101XTB0_9BACL|nr:hypothetical protein [Ferroacidibacillus organovorans]KUO97110.1 hypothetical protein ATW55_12420 [Ferroacidibacillus organovorans]